MDKNSLDRLRSRYFALPPFGRTLVEAFLVIVATHILTPHLARGLTIPSDVAHRQAVDLRGIGESLKWNVEAYFLVVAGVVAFDAALEELLFRGIPLLLLRRATKGKGGDPCVRIAGTFGIVSSVAFALAHDLSFRTFPLPQFLFGMFAWNAAYRRGLRHSVLMHFLVNFYSLVLVPLACVLFTVYNWKR